MTCKSSSFFSSSYWRNRFLRSSADRRSQKGWDTGCANDPLSIAVLLALLICGENVHSPVSSWAFFSSFTESFFSFSLLSWYKRYMKMYIHWYVDYRYHWYWQNEDTSKMDFFSPEGAVDFIFVVSEIWGYHQIIKLWKEETTMSVNVPGKYISIQLPLSFSLAWPTAPFYFLHDKVAHKQR